MDSKRKKGLAILLGVGKPEREEEGGEMDGTDAQREAAQNLLDAIDEKDVDKIVEALNDFLDVR
jgi:hypothetical protein